MSVQEDRDLLASHWPPLHLRLTSCHGAPKSVGAIAWTGLMPWKLTISWSPVAYDTHANSMTIGQNQEGESDRDEVRVTFDYASGVRRVAEVRPEWMTC